MTDKQSLIFQAQSLWAAEGQLCSYYLFKDLFFFFLSMKKSNMCCRSLQVPKIYDNYYITV